MSQVKARQSYAGHTFLLRDIVGVGYLPQAPLPFLSLALSLSWQPYVTLPAPLLLLSYHLASCSPLISYLHHLRLIDEFLKLILYTSTLNINQLCPFIIVHLPFTVLIKPISSLICLTPVDYI